MKIYTNFEVLYLIFKYIPISDSINKMIKIDDNLINFIEKTLPRAIYGISNFNISKYLNFKKNKKINYLVAVILEAVWRQQGSVTAF